MAELELGGSISIVTGEDYGNSPYFQVEFCNGYGNTPTLHKEDAIKVIQILSDCFGLDVVINKKENKDAN